MAQLVQAQRDYFLSGKTRSLESRLAALRALSEGLKECETEILEALQADLHKPKEEAFLAEVGFLIEEIRFALKHLPKWVKPQKQRGSFLTPFGRSEIYPEPLGVVLVIGPWNYPCQLVLSPLIGAIAAGNCGVLKPSELAPQTSKVIARLVASVFPPAFVTVVEGGLETSQALLLEKWDHIFFTGGTAIGKHVMAAAAHHLTPVTLELGGKSPCLVDENTDLEVTARRITWGKFMNAGQTCVAPDYLLVPTSLVTPLARKIAESVHRFFGEDPKTSPDYGRIIHQRHFERLLGLINPRKVFFGGQSDSSSCYLAPTLMTEVTAEDKVMGEEIFGPILPIVEYTKWEEALAWVKARPKPLALYYFGKNREREAQVIEQLSFGGGCVTVSYTHLTLPTKA